VLFAAIWQVSHLYSVLAGACAILWAATAVQLLAHSPSWVSLLQFICHPASWVCLTPKCCACQGVVKRSA
jgi:hypothetical protein